MSIDKYNLDESFLLSHFINDYYNDGLKRVVTNENEEWMDRANPQNSY